MFVGDSITGYPGCWRVPIWLALTDSRHVVDMVGFRSNPGECGAAMNTAGAQFDSDHSATAGITTTGMWVKLATDGIYEQSMPDVVVILLGTNDLVGGASAADIMAQYTQHVDLARKANPSMAIVVATPLPISAERCACQSEVAAISAALPAWAQETATEASPVTVADIATDFDPQTLTDDGVHPNAEGAAVMAQAFTPVVMDAVESAEAARVVAESDDEGAQSLSVWAWLGIAGLAAAAAAVAIALRRPRGRDSETS